MSTSTLAKGHRRAASAYPPDVAALMPAARRLAMKAGTVPSRRALMRELHIGGPKADAVLTKLTASTDIAPPHGPDTAAPTAPDGPPPTDSADDDATHQAGSVTTTEPADDTPTPDTAAPADAVPGTEPETEPGATRRVPVWPVLLLTLPALVAIWSGWVGLGGMAGFGVVHPLPGIWDDATLNTAITLPIGVEVYAAYALWVWLSGGVPARAMRFARASAVVSLAVGALGQITYHLLSAAHVTHAPWPITTAVACLPVAVLGMGAALAHLVRSR